VSRHTVEEYHAAMQALRAERDHPDDEPTVDDFCRICDEPTDRTDRLCDLHHNAALDLSDNLRRLR
jgi:hypothetical protein